jgi:predicted component of type VI protein secretion system
MTQRGGRFSLNKHMLNTCDDVSSAETTTTVCTPAIVRPAAPVTLTLNATVSPEQMIDNRSVTAEQLRSGFVALAVRLFRRYAGGRDRNPDFPLRGTLSLRSNISLVFNDSEIHDCELGERKGKLWLNILTLAGVNGVLPSRLTEDILAAKRRGGESLHEFFDLLNRRFWELLFQSYRIGTRPQYGFHDHGAQGLIQDLAQSYVGLRGTPALAQTMTPPEYHAYLLRFCFHSRNGAGGLSGLAELLSQAISRPVTVRDWSTCKLPVPERYQMRLRSSSGLTLLGGKCVLGRRTQVRRFLLIDVEFSACDWAHFCPATGGWAIRALVGAIHVSLADRVAVIAANYKVRVPPINTVRLGQITCRLGWGACLGGAATHTSLVQISAFAISNLQK